MGARAGWGPGVIRGGAGPCRRVLAGAPRAPQLFSESQGHTAHLLNSVSDVLDALQRDRGLGRPRVKADLQRAPARGLRPRGCASGERGAQLCTPMVPPPPLR